MAILMGQESAGGSPMQRVGGVGLQCGSMVLRVGGCVRWNGKPLGSLGCTHLVLLLGNSQLKLFILAWFEMIYVHCHFCVMLDLVIDQIWIITNLH